jgi:hypothetical protein
MLKITDKDLNSMSLDDLRALTKRIKIAEKNQRLSTNKAVAETLVAGDTIEFSLPKTNEIQTGVVAKVKRVMIAIKAPSGSEQWNVPLTSVVKKISSAPVKRSKVVEKVKANVASAKKVTKTVSKTVTKPKAASTGKTTAKAKPAPTTSSSSTNIIKALKEKAAAKKAAASKKDPIETTILAPTSETPASE